jgi:predicted MPP superfamily phosphohydrolase
MLCDAAALWMGIGLLVFSYLLVYELLKMFFRPRRRVTGVVILALTAVTSIYAMINARVIRVSTVNIKAPVSIKMVQLSDIHLRSTDINLLRRVVERTNELEADVVVMTGDIFDSGQKQEEEVISILNKLGTPVFFVMGNHERYGGIEKVTELLAKTKVKILRNEAVVFKGIEIIGIDDTGSEEELAEKLSKLKINKSGYSVLLHHRPIGIEAVSNAGVDLMVCGHTHNGQIFPFNYIVGLSYEHIKGLYNYGDFHLYVSTGTGTWGPRMRLGSKAGSYFSEGGD